MVFTRRVIPFLSSVSEGCWCVSDMQCAGLLVKRSPVLVLGGKMTVKSHQLSEAKASKKKARSPWGHRIFQ